MLKDTMLFLARQDSIRRFVSSNPAARRVARRFVAGETLDEALMASQALNRRHISVSLDHLGENVSDEAEAEAAARGYIETLDQIRPTYTFEVSCQWSVPQSILAFLESADFEAAAPFLTTAAFAVAVVPVVAALAGRRARGRRASGASGLAR